jgi:hypothetical protein
LVYSPEKQQVVKATNPDFIENKSRKSVEISQLREVKQEFDKKSDNSSSKNKPDSENVGKQISRNFDNFTSENSGENKPLPPNLLSNPPNPPISTDSQAATSTKPTSRASKRASKLTKRKKQY